VKRGIPMVLIAIVVIVIVTLFSLGLLRLTQYKTLFSMSSSAKEVTITDVLGRNVTLPYPVRKVIVTDDEVAELVQLMKAADRVVGIEPSIRDRGYFYEMADKPVTGSQFRDLNYELIAELKPDVVIMMDVGPIGKIIDKLDKIGVKAVVISIDPKKIPQSIMLLGKIFGEEERAKALLDWWKEKWEFLGERIRTVEGKRELKVFIGMGFAPSNKLPTRTWGDLAKWNYILNVLKTKNIALGKLKAYGELDVEYIVKEDPDIIIVGDWSDNWLGYTKNSTELAKEMVRAVLNDPVLSGVKAVKDRRIFIMHYVMLGSFRSVVGAYYLAKIAYPDSFKDVNPEEMHREYFEKLLDVPYKGVWFYPCPWLGEDGG